MPEKEFVLIRDYKPEATPGRLIDPKGKEIIKTLERPREVAGKENQRDDLKTSTNESTCIPEGNYVCKKYASARFPDTWEITGVPGRTAILFHPANYVHELKGCIATAITIQDMNPKKVDGIKPEKRWYASQSRDAFKIFKEKMPKQFLLRITSNQTLCND